MKVFEGNFKRKGKALISEKNPWFQGFKKTHQFMTYSVLFKINRPSTAVNTRFTTTYSDLPVFIRNHSFFIFCLLDYNLHSLTEKCFISTNEKKPPFRTNLNGGLCFHVIHFEFRVTNRIFWAIWKILSIFWNSENNVF